LQQPEIDNEVINHLLFHKSLIDEKDDTTRINHYVSMLQKADEGEHISIEDPFDRSIAIAFELVMQQHLNPWDIDLVKFSTMYLKRAKDEKIDLMTAGRIIYMAWRVLKLQSDDLVVAMESHEEEYEPFGWGDIPTEMWLSKDDAYSYTNLVMNMPESPLDEPIRRNAKRKVAEKARKRMKGTAVEDHLEEDVEAVWQKIKKIPKKTMSLMDLCERKGREELIKILMSVLFLAMDNKVLIYQKKFPYGKIYIKNMRYS